MYDHVEKRHENIIYSHGVVRKELRQETDYETLQVCNQLYVISIPTKNLPEWSQCMYGLHSYKVSAIDLNLSQHYIPQFYIHAKLNLLLKG